MGIGVAEADNGAVAVRTGHGAGITENTSSVSVAET